MFIIPDFTTLSINSVQVVSGTRTPASDALLIDSGGLRLLGAREGTRVRLRLSGDARDAGQALLAGVVHDAGIAPASIERKVTAYATPELLSRLGLPATLDRLKLVFRPDALSRTEVIGRAVARDLTALGYSVREIQIPPRGEHPHQLLNDALLVVLIAFGLLGLVAGSVLTRHS